MAKYYIESYNKVEQSFLSALNSMSHDGDIKDKQAGVIYEPYKIKLKKVSFFGKHTTFITKDIELPKGFPHKQELTKGREWILS